MLKSTFRLGSEAQVITDIIRTATTIHIDTITGRTTAAITTGPIIGTAGSAITTVTIATITIGTKVP